MDLPAADAVLVAADLSDHSCLTTADAVLDTSLPAIFAGYEDAAAVEAKRALRRSAAVRSAGRPVALRAALAPIACPASAQ
uniref:Uncharacterized protein n=1 Tax=Arundo donax TaxID=35708 RepID=A0A0A9GL23_ARUDO